MVLFFEINKKLEPLSWVHDHNIGRYYRSGEHNKNSDGDGYCLPSFLKKESQNVWNFKCRLNMAKNEISFAFRNSLLYPTNYHYQTRRRTHVYLKKSFILSHKNV